VKRNFRNRSVMSAVKTLVRKVESAVETGNREDAAKTLQETVRALDRAASKGVIHKNTASRNVSRLTRKVNGLSPKATEGGAA
jgi:small subunit ribosomal protein S20